MPVEYLILLDTIFPVQCDGAGAQTMKIIHDHLGIVWAYKVQDGSFVSMTSK